MHPVDQWLGLVGETVEVWRDGKLYRKGLVDAAMPDGSGLWIGQEGAYQREFVDAAYGYQVRSRLYPKFDVSQRLNSSLDQATKRPDLS
jgi:hypothetical protein